MSLIELQGVSVRKQGRSILQDIHLSIHSGEIVTIIGPNGAGKTTLVKTLLGLDKPSTGKIIRQVGLIIGYMPQKMHSDHTMPLTVEHFLRLAPGVSHERVNDILSWVRITPLRDRMMYHLSGGEMQRVLLARALLRNPQLLVLDEPAQGIDVMGQAEFYALIEQIREKQHCGIVLISHDLHWVMAKTDRVICLNHHICCHGHPEMVSRAPAFQQLFGVREFEGLAPYTHHHDHNHGLSGDVVTERSP